MKDQPTVNGMNADHFNQSALLVKSQTNLPLPRDANSRTKISHPGKCDLAFP